MIRRLILAASLCLAPAAAALAQPALARVAAAPTDSAQCAAVHAMMLQHATAMGLDSTQLAALHATMREAIAQGASSDSLHHAILGMFMHGTHAANGSADATGHMHLDSSQAAAIHACLDSHANTMLEKRR